MYQVVCYTCKGQRFTDFDQGQKLFIDHMDQRHEVELLHTKSEMRNVDFNQLEYSTEPEQINAASTAGSSFSVDK